MSEPIISQGDGWRIVQRDGENILVTDTPDHWFAQCLRMRMKMDKEYNQLTDRETEVVKTSLVVPMSVFAGYFETK